MLAVLAITPKNFRSYNLDVIIFLEYQIEFSAVFTGARKFHLTPGCALHGDMSFSRSEWSCKFIRYYKNSAVLTLFDNNQYTFIQWICKKNNHKLASGKDREIWLSGNCFKQFTSVVTGNHSFRRVWRQNRPGIDRTSAGHRRIFRHFFGIWRAPGSF